MSDLMKLNEDKAAFPSDAYNTVGLSKREYFAALAMQGILANPEYFGGDIDMAENSVTAADFLLKELAKP